MQELSDADLARVRRLLLTFYQRHRRDLPWRRTHDGYQIWVSEIMLQQTQVDTVVPRYARFLQIFPNVQALAEAPVEAVCEAWAGLGYYRRARHLHAAARVLVEEHGGILPTSVEALRRLPGIGAYTAGAIASIAYGVCAPLVDGNVARVIARLCALELEVDAPAGRRFVWQVAGRLVVGKDPGNLNQALMELGATVCVPMRPRCDACCVARFCAARKTGEPERLPRLRPKAARVALRVAYAFCWGSQGLWLARRPLTGLWAGLWEPPSQIGRGAKARLSEALQTTLGPPLATLRHDLTHRRVTAVLYAAQGAQMHPGPDLQEYAHPLQAPLSALARKAVLAFARCSGGRG